MIAFLLRLSLTVKCDLLKSGFMTNEETSEWEPAQIITWLGVIDGKATKATSERLVKLNTDVAFLSIRLPPEKVHVKSVAGIAGQIISLTGCVGTVASIMTRLLFSVVNHRTNVYILMPFVKH